MIPNLYPRSWSSCSRLGAVGLCLAIPSRAFSQGHHVRRDGPECAQQESAVMHPPNPAEFSTAVYVLLTHPCPDAGPRILAKRWADPPADSTETLDLATASRPFDDQRLLDAVTAAATRLDNPMRIRLHAMMVLASMYDHEQSASLWLPDARRPPILSWGYITEGGDRRAGARPATPAGKAAILQTFRTMAASDPDTLVRRFAGEAFKHFGGGS